MLPQEINKAIDRVTKPLIRMKELKIEIAKEKEEKEKNNKNLR